MSAAAFQTTVNFQMGFGLQGDRYNDDPFRAKSWALLSEDPAYNIIGATFYTVVDEVYVQAGSGGGNGTQAGLLVNPHVYTTAGDGVNALNPTLVLPNQTQAELATMGSFVVFLPAAADIGDLVVFDNTTGAISTVAPGDPLPTDTTFANAAVTYREVTGAGLGVITLTPALIAPV